MRNRLHESKAPPLKTNPPITGRQRSLQQLFHHKVGYGGIRCTVVSSHVTCTVWSFVWLIHG